MLFVLANLGLLTLNFLLVAPLASGVILRNDLAEISAQSLLGLIFLFLLGKKLNSTFSA